MQNSCRYFGGFLEELLHCHSHFVLNAHPLYDLMRSPKWDTDSIYQEALEKARILGEQANLYDSILLMIIYDAS